MGAMIEKEILEAFQSALIVVVANSTVPLMQIMMVGRTLETIPDNYLEVVHIPNNRTGEYYGNERTYQGIFRVLYHSPKDDKGPYAPMQYLGEIADGFPKEKVMINGAANLKIYDVPVAESVIPSGSELLFPLTLRYRCFRP